MKTLLLAAVLVTLAQSVLATECVTGALDVRRADVVAVARYAGERTFTVESILRAMGERPSKLVLPEAPAETITVTSSCGPPAPDVGGLYLVALYPAGFLDYRPYANTSYERSLIEKLHNVSTRSILDALKSYGDGVLTRDQTHDWLTSAVIEPRHEQSFTEELLEAAEDLLNRVAISEACNKDVVLALRTRELPAAVRVIARRLPAVDNEREYVAQRSPVSSEDDALNEWDDILGNIKDALGPLQERLRALPWCDHEKHGW